MKKIERWQAWLFISGLLLIAILIEASPLSYRNRSDGWGRRRLSNDDFNTVHRSSENQPRVVSPQRDQVQAQSAPVQTGLPKLSRGAVKITTYTADGTLVSEEYPPVRVFDSKDSAIEVVSSARYEEAQRLQNGSIQKNWPNGVTPTRQYTVPTDLVLPPDKRGVYHWTEHISVGDDVVIEIQQGWNYSFNNSDNLKGAYRNSAGEWGEIPRGKLTDVHALRFKTNPSNQRDVTIQFTLTKAP